MKLILDVSRDMAGAFGNFQIIEKVEIMHLESGLRLLECENNSGPDAKVETGKMRFDVGEQTLIVKMSFARKQVEK